MRQTSCSYIIYTLYRAQKKPSRNCKQNAIQLWKPPPPPPEWLQQILNFVISFHQQEVGGKWLPHPFTAPLPSTHTHTVCVRRVRVLNIITISNMFGTILNVLTFTHNSLHSVVRQCRCLVNYFLNHSSVLSFAAKQFQLGKMERNEMGKNEGVTWVSTVSKPFWWLPQSANNNTPNELNEIMETIAQWHTINYAVRCSVQTNN